MLMILKNFSSVMSRYSIQLIEKAKMTEHTFMIFVALIIGVLGGFGAILIRKMISYVSFFSFPGSGSILDNIQSLPWYMILGVPTLGGLIVGPIIHFFAQEAKGHGVPEVMESLLLKGGAIRPRVAIVKTIASAITIGTGGSVGREGPIVQIGATLGSTIGAFLRVSATRMKTFVGCGAAAGIAAAFNAPISGALFAVEILLGDFAFAQFSPIVISSVMATVISHQFEGNFAAFRVPSYEMISPYELIFYSVLGALCAIVAYLFIRVLYFSEDLFGRRFNIPEYLKPMAGGLLIGLMAIGIPEVMGLGYDSVNNALNGRMIWYLALMLIFFKIIATSITLGSGGSGGIFTPSLFLGSMTGTAFGWLIHHYFPGISASPGAYALVAMGGLVAGTTHAPITAIIIVFELTNDYHIILPLMITCIISTILSSRFSRESIYTLKLIQRNIHLKNGVEVNIMKSLFVKDLYKPNPQPISESANFYEVVNRIVSSTHTCFPVVNKEGGLTGLITLNDVKDFLFEKEILRDVLIAADIAHGNFQKVMLNEDCQSVLDKFRMDKRDGLPVVDHNQADRLIGMIWRKDIMDAYDDEVKRNDLSASFASMITMRKVDQSVHFMEGYAITELRVPKWFIGKSIKEVNVRARFGVDIILIRTKNGKEMRLKVIPEPDFIFSAEDSLVIAGEIGKINLLKERS